MTWDAKKEGKRWGERRLKKVDPFRGGIKIYEVDVLDENGSVSYVEEMELQPFLDFCICCGQNVVDVRKGSGCSIRNECCAVCWRECERLGICQLK